ncbi:MAG: T9SS type A sorting domain-containing protein, partial [Bacteroidota bacterium]
MNDVGVPHLRTGSEPLGIEVQVTAWAIASTNEVLDRATYYRYRIVNKSGQPIDDMVLTMFADMDLGNEFEDDYVGSSPSINLGYNYNADNEDEGGYGTPPPAIGLRFLDQEMGAFTYFNNGTCEDTCDPGTAEQFRFYQTARWKDGQPFTEGGRGRGGSQPVNFVYPGDPGFGYWTEVCPNESNCGSPIQPSDRRFLMSTNPTDLATGASRDLTFALPFAFGAQNFGPSGSVVAMQIASNDIQAAFDSGALFDAAPRLSALSAPTSLVPSSGTTLFLEENDESPVLSWDPVPGAEAYQVSLEIDQGDRIVRRSIYRTTTEYPLASVLPVNRIYSYRWSVEAEGRFSDGTRVAGERSATQTFAVYRYVPTIAQNGAGLVEVVSASGANPCEGTPDDAGCADNLGGNTVWQDADATGDYYVSSGAPNGLLGDVTRNRAIVQEDEVELRFTAACAEPGACLGVYLSSRDGEVASVPFEAWYLADTPNDPADDLRMIPYLVSNGTLPVTNFADAFTGTDPWADGPGAPITERVLLFMPDRPDGYARFDADARSFGGPGALYDRDGDGDMQEDIAPLDSEPCRLQGMYTDFCYRGSNRDRSNALYSDFVFADASGDGTTPAVGTVIRFVTAKRLVVSDEGEAPQTAALTLSAYPNPVRGTATLAYTLPESGRATLAVYDVLGRRVAVVTDATQAAGAHVETFDTRQLASGVYVAVLATEAGQQTRRFTVLR